MKILSTIVPAAAVLALLTGCSAANSKPVVIMGNAYGLWSPTHPHITMGKSKPNSPVLYIPPPPEPEPVIKPDPEVVMVPDVCPTQSSQPHLCTVQ